MKPVEAVCKHTNIPPKGMKRKRCKCADCGKRRICDPTNVDGFWVYWCESCYQAEFYMMEEEEVFLELEEEHEFELFV